MVQVCGPCNKSMGVQNLFEFRATFFRPADSVSGASASASASASAAVVPIAGLTGTSTTERQVAANKDEMNDDRDESSASQAKHSNKAVAREDGSV